MFSVILRNISLNYSGSFVMFFVSFLLTPLLVRHLGGTLYGIWVALHSIIFYVKFLDLGLYNALVKFISEYRASNDGDRLNALVRTALGIYSVLGLVALVACCSLSLFLSTIIKIPSDYLLIAQIGLVLFGLDLLFAFPEVVFDAVVEGHQRFDILNACSVGFRLLGALGTVVLVFSGYGLLPLIGLEVVMSMLGIMVDLVIMRRYFPEIRLGIGFSGIRKMKRFLRFSFWSFLYDLVSEGGAELEKFLIPILFSVTMATHYSIAYSLAALLFAAIHPIVDVLFPMASGLDARKELEKLQRLALLGTKYVFAISLPLCAALLIMRKTIITILFTESYVDPSSTLLIFILSSFLVTVFFLTSMTVLMGMSKLRILFLSTIIESAVTIALALIIVPRYGIVGIAVSFSTANILTSFAVLFPCICRTLELSPWNFLLETMIRPLLPLAPAAGAGLFLAARWTEGGFLFLLVNSAVIGGLYVAVFYWLSATRYEKDNATRLWTHFSNKLKGVA